MRRQNHRTLILLTLLVAAGLFSALFRVVIVQGDSMNPAYQNGQVLLASKNGNVLPGDVILFSNHGKVLLKRVWAGPGDLVRMEGGSLSVNGTVLSNYRCDREGTFRLEQGMYWVLGDNADNSFDSRQFGPVDQNQILGIVLR